MTNIKIEKVKKKQINQITEMKNRKLYDKPRWNQYFDQYVKLSRCYVNYHQTLTLEPETTYELLKYLPVSFVAVIQIYFNRAIADLIDFGDEFSTNAQKAFSNVTFQLESVFAIHKKEVSIGEVVSNLISINRIEDVLLIFEKVIGSDFNALINCVEYPWPTFKPIKFGDEREEIIKHLKEMFEKRHKICHELTEWDIVNFFDANDYLQSMHKLIYCIENVINSKIHI